MDRPNETNEKDNELAEFTDRLLDAKTKSSASNSDEELLSLEKTIFRLSDSFPPTAVDEAKAKQMLVRLKSRMKREEEAAKPSIWKRLFNFQSNSQMGLLVTLAVVVLVALVSVPVLQPSGSAASGSAVSGSDVFAVIGVASVFFIMYWISRRR